MKNEKVEIIEEILTDRISEIEEKIEEKKDDIMEALIPRKIFLEKIITDMLRGLVFLLPIFFLPISGLYYDFSKNILLSLFVIVTFILSIFLWIRQGKVVLPKSKIFMALLFLVAVYSFSSLLSGVFTGSFFGTGNEVASAYEIFILSITTFLFTAYFRTEKHLFSIFVALFASSFFVFLFQIFHFIFPGISIAGLFPTKTATLIGSWSDFGIFSGVVAIVSLIALEKLPENTFVNRKFLYAFLAVSLFFYSISIFTGSWIILALITTFLSVYFFFDRISSLKTRNISIAEKWLATPSFVVAVISVVMIFSGTFVNAKLFGAMNIPPVQDVRPSWSGTIQIFNGMFKEDIKQSVFGVGPNRFFIPWQKYRPVDINYTPWWNVDFNEGAGTIPTSIITVGIVGAIAWIIFLLSFIIGGIHNLRKKLNHASPRGQFIALSSFVIALYIFAVAFFGGVGAVPFILGFIFTGVFLGALSSFGSPKVREYFYTGDPKKGFVIMVLLLVLLGLSVFIGYRGVARTRSYFANHNAIVLGQAGNYQESNAEFKKAISLAPSDSYYRSFSALNSYQATGLITRTDLSADELRSQFGVSFQGSVESAKVAIAVDDANYLNWLTLANAYSILVPLGIQGISSDAYTQAKISLEQASKRNPYNPQIFYMQARLALANKQTGVAVEYLRQSLSLKSDYNDALLLLAEIEESKGNLKNAITILENSPTVSLSDPTMLFQLGYLRYKNGNYDTAVTALEKAVSITPNYANAKYFLGLSYFEFGRRADAIQQFKDIEKLNPDRTDVAQMIRNIQNGLDPLPSTAPKLDPTVLTTPTKKK